MKEPNEPSSDTSLLLEVEGKRKFTVLLMEGYA
jgi:hypothetical protein